jgi:hypothetical protein
LLASHAPETGLTTRVEADLGRRRSSDKYASRPIDLDLLLYDDCVLSNNQLTLPDPDILERAFVAIPLCELAPDLLLPGSGLPICRVAERFAAEDMECLAEYTRLLRNELLTPAPGQSLHELGSNRLVKHLPCASFCSFPLFEMMS